MTTLKGVVFIVVSIKVLVWRAVINGHVAVPNVATMVQLTDHRAAMGDFKLPVGLKIAGWVATLVMTAAALGLLLTWAG